MKDGWDSTSWDEEWLEEYKTDAERLRDQAARSLDQYPEIGYGLLDNEEIPVAQSQAEIADGRLPKLSRGRVHSRYTLFSKANSPV